MEKRSRDTKYLKKIFFILWIAASWLDKVLDVYWWWFLYFTEVSNGFFIDRKTDNGLSSQFEIMKSAPYDHLIMHITKKNV